MMPMTFEVSNNVTLLFDFWEVHSAAGMAVSVIVVLLLTVFYEILKVWRVWLSTNSMMHRSQTPPPYTRSSSIQTDTNSVLESDAPLAPKEQSSFFPKTRNSWLLHVVQTLLHLLQVVLGYMLMLCVMSYNTWIFLGVVLGSVLGYFLAFPLISHTQ
ncbi:protein SLC31A2 isoform 1-T1 [Synchiropus picturatus]